MTARTCLLCGKSLSRIWAGGGEDFCSREHRNQYRMRRGMDRLLEANKISSVMRRREIPKPIAQPVSSPGGDIRLPDSSRIRIAARTRDPRPFARLPRLAAHLPQSGELLVVPVSLLGDAQYREFQILRNQPFRLVYLTRRTRIASAAAGSIDRSTPTARLAPAARKGRALRVSLGAGFHLPVVPEHQFGSHSIAAAKLVWVETPHRTFVGAMSSPPRVFHVPIGISAKPVLPDFRISAANGFVWPGPLPITVNIVAATAVAPRRSDMTMSHGDPLQPVLQVRIRRAGLSSKFAGLPQPPAVSAASQRITVVPFASQDVPAQPFLEEHPSK